MNWELDTFRAWREQADLYAQCDRRVSGAWTWTVSDAETLETLDDPAAHGKCATRAAAMRAADAYLAAND